MLDLNLDYSTLFLDKFNCTCFMLLDIKLTTNRQIGIICNFSYVSSLDLEVISLQYIYPCQNRLTLLAR